MGAKILEASLNLPTNQKLSARELILVRDQSQKRQKKAGNSLKNSIRHDETLSNPGRAGGTIRQQLKA